MADRPELEIRRPEHGRRPRRARPKRSAQSARSQERNDEERALRKIFLLKPAHEARHFEEVERYTRKCEEDVERYSRWEEDLEQDEAFRGYAIADPSKLGNVGNGDVIEDFLCQLDDKDMGASMPSRPATAPREMQVTLPSPRPFAARSAERLAEKVEDLKMKLNNSLRENRKLKDIIEAKDQKIRRLLDDFDRIRKDPNVMHPTISRLRKLGLNTPLLAELQDRWSGYVFGRISMAMEVGSYSYRNVFATHSTYGVLNEEAFKSVIRQFEPHIKGDQLTRLWFFADEDGSGKIDLFEFMRMLGCNSNGEMGDEYYEVLATHLYRKFHARGGVRRVYATADKNWDQHLDLAEFTRFIKTFLKDVEFTKRETQQVFRRINTSGSGFMTLQELETALEAAGAKCYVSDAWVKETFQQFTMAVQEAGQGIKQLWPGGYVTEKEFRDVVMRFMTQLRPTQLDRLWRFLYAACAEDVISRHGEKDRLPSENVYAVVFGPTLTSSVNEPSDTRNGAGGVGREALEQLVQQLVRRVGDASADLCFDALGPFITPEHFKQLLSARLGLHYDPVKAKQIFKLLDTDRDGKITRLEFTLMFKTVTPDVRDLEPEDERETEKLQLSRLHNRVLLLQRELENLRGAGRNNEPTVPEKQFQQLTAAHAKVASQMHVLKEQKKEARGGTEEAPPTRDGSRRTEGRKSQTFNVEEIWSPQMDRTEAEEFQSQLQELADSNLYLRRRLRLCEDKAQEERSEDSGVASPKRAEDEAISQLPLPRVEELYGPAHLILAKLQKALAGNPSLSRKSVQDLLMKSGDVVVEGRWKIQNILNCSARMVVAVCSDAFLREDVVVKVGQTLEASQQLARAVYILRRLHDVSIAPQVHYFSSPTSSLPYMVMDLLQGSTLQSRFQSIEEGQVEAIVDLEAAELGYSLLTGMDACHQRQVFNLNLCPEHVWVSPRLEGSRVKILDWNNAEVGAGSLLNLEAYAVGDMRRRGLLRGSGRPLFQTSAQVEVQVMDIWACARKRSGAKTPSALSAMSSLSLYGHGSFYYMSLEQIYGAVRCFEKDTAPVRPEQTWHQESVGSVVKVEGRIVHWFQKGDGFVQTSLPIRATPLGQLFEVEVVRAVNAGKRSNSELGFCIGLCSRPPRRDEKGRQKQDCWLAGGDCAYYLKGVQHRVGKDDEQDMSSDDRYLRVTSDLKPKDRVAILAEWNGSLSLYLNGQKCGYFAKAIDPVEVMAPFYGVADIYVRQASEEYTVRSISIVEESQGESAPEQQQAAMELASIHEHLHGEAAVSTTIGPSCDLYACGRILLSCFRGGALMRPSLHLDRFAVAYAEWARAGCPATEKRYALLWALKELKNEKTERSEELQEIDKLEVRLLLSRCVKRSRYSRLGSCWEAAEMLAQASCWLGMTEEFLNSHKVAVEQAKRASLLDAHYSMAQEIFEEPTAAARAGRAVQLAEERAAPGISARWNLRAFSLGNPHIRRIVQVFREWQDGGCIQAVMLSRFEANISPDLQDAFLQCFSNVLQSQHAKVLRRKHNHKELRHSVGNIELDARKPLIFLEDVQLPAEELQRASFPLEEIFQRNVLWLVAMQVGKLDLTPAPAGLGQEKPLSIGTAPGAMETLISAMERSKILNSLLLRSSNLRDNAGQLLSGAIAKCPKLQELDLSDNLLGPKAVSKVLQGGRYSLQLLDLSRNRLGDEGARAVAEALGKGPSSGYSLSVLRLRGNSIGDEGAESIAEALMSVVSLVEFDLAENQVSVQSCASVLRAICAAKIIKRLYLDGNLPWPSSEDGEVLLASFTDQLSGSSTSSLEVLNLRHCKMYSTGASKLFESLRSNSFLRKLNLACCGLRQGAAPAIAHALASSMALEDLDLRDNRLGLQDALSIAFHQVFGEEEARENRWLRSLNLGNNELSGESFDRLTPALCNFSALEELYVYHNPLGDLGARAVAELLRPEAVLLHLNLAACGIEDAGCEALMAALGGYKVLRSLDLSCNSIGDDSAPSVASVLSQRSCQLERLCLSMNSISSYGVSQLMDGVSRNLDGSLREVDVSSQDGTAKTSFIPQDPSPRSGNKVKSKFVGLR